MKMSNIKDSYLLEWIREISVIQIDIIDIERVHDTLNIRASKYDSGTENGREYDNFIFRLSEDVLTELAFLSENEVNNVIKRLFLIKERCNKAIVNLKKHSKDFESSKFQFKEFEDDLSLWLFFPFAINNKPLHDIYNLHISKYLFSDILEAFDRKINALDWVILSLEQIFFPDRNNGFPTMIKYRPRSILLSEVDQQLLYDELSYCVPLNQKELFKQVLEGKEILEPIMLECSQAQSKLSKAFSKVLKTSGIMPKACSQWLYKNFRRSEPNLDATFSESTLYTTLKSGIKL
jgi:hypothetical protein